MISRMLGAFFGGTTRIGQAGLDWLALSWIKPSNLCGGAGRNLPSTVVVALGEPGVPLSCCAVSGTVDVCCAWIGRVRSHMKAARVPRTTPPGSWTYLTLRFITYLAESPGTRTPQPQGFDFARPPRLVEPGLQRALESQYGVSILSGVGTLGGIGVEFL